AWWHTARVDPAVVFTAGSLVFNVRHVRNGYVLGQLGLDLAGPRAHQEGPAAVQLEDMLDLSHRRQRQTCGTRSGRRYNTPRRCLAAQLAARSARHDRE